MSRGAKLAADKCSFQSLRLEREACCAATTSSGQINIQMHVAFIQFSESSCKLVSCLTATAECSGVALNEWQQLQAPAMPSQRGLRRLLQRPYMLHVFGDFPRKNKTPQSESGGLAARLCLVCVGAAVAVCVCQWRHRY